MKLWQRKQWINWRENKYREAKESEKYLAA